MLALILSAASVLLTAALFVAGQMLLGTNLPLRLVHEGYAVGTVGLVMIHYSFGFMAGSFLGPRLIRRVGHIRVFAAFAAITCCATLLHGAFIDPVLWGFLRAVSGFCGALLLIVIESWINAHATPTTRGRLMGFYMITYYVAGSLGQLMVGLNEPSDFRAYSLAAGLLVLAAVPLALTSRPAPPLPQAGRLPLRELYEASRISVVGALFSGFAMASFYQLAPIYVLNLGQDTQTVARYMACAVVGSMLFQYPFGKLADRYDRRRVILGIALCIAGSALLVAVFGGLSLSVLFVASMLFTGMAACLYPACLARLNDRTGGRHHVGANATLLLCYGVGQCLGPVLTSRMMGLVGPSGLYYGIAIALLLYAGFVVWRLRVADTAVPDQQKFVPVAPSTPVIAELDPRAPNSERPS